MFILIPILIIVGVCVFVIHNSFIFYSFNSFTYLLASL